MGAAGSEDHNQPPRGRAWLMLIAVAATVPLVAAARTGRAPAALLLAVTAGAAWLCVNEAVSARKELTRHPPDPGDSDTARAFHAFRELSAAVMRPRRHADYAALREAALTQFEVDHPGAAADPAMQAWIGWRMPETREGWRRERCAQRGSQTDAWAVPAMWCLIGLLCLAAGGFWAVAVWGA